MYQINIPFYHIESDHRHRTYCTLHLLSQKTGLVCTVAFQLTSMHTDSVHVHESSVSKDIYNLQYCHILTTAQWQLQILYSISLDFFANLAKCTQKDTTLLQYTVL